MLLAVRGVSFLAIIAGLLMSFLPSVWAILRGNVNKRQVVLYQVFFAVATVIAGVVIGLITAFVPLKFVIVICGGGWAVVSVMMWLYIMCSALRDTEMMLLRRLGINI